MNEFNNRENTIDFDFDEWMELCQKDPENFEKKRQDLIQSVIDQAPKKMQRRLNGLQWRIDSEVKLAKNPLDGCITVYEMMLDSVYEPGGLLDALSMTEGEVKKSVPNVIKLNGFAKVTELED